jgi:predicted phosphodiesterase
VRIAVVSDIHGNRTAFEAVLADLQETSPDLILHGGDLADGGASPAEIIDRVRDLGWRGVPGNADEVYSRPESLEEFASQSSAPTALWDAVREMVGATRAVLGQERISWLSRMPQVQIEHPVALVHATPGSCWRAPGLDASDTELESVYGPLGQRIAVYGHIHRSFIRTVPCLHGQEMLVINTGSVSHSYDGDRRAAYLLLDGSKPTIRRVEYDLEKEVKALSTCGLPHSDWVIRILLSASPQMP